MNLTPAWVAAIGAVSLFIGTFIQLLWSIGLLRSTPPKEGEEGRKTYEWSTCAGWVFMFLGALATAIAAVNVARGTPVQ